MSARPTILAVLLAAGTASAQDRAASLDIEIDAPYGEYLVDAEGRTLYAFTPDRGKRRSTCEGACARAWPPLTTTSKPTTAAPTLPARKLGTIEREDGTRQVTYAGWPLYYYERDTVQDEITGQDLHSFGGEWYLLGPDGKLIEKTVELSHGEESLWAPDIRDVPIR